MEVEEVSRLRKAFLIHLVTFLIVPISFFICYGIAVSENHVDALFPFISDTGTFAPESCVFGQLINIAAILVGVCVYLRHRQIVSVYPDRQKIKSVSNVFLWLGWIGAFGTSLVANCQETRCRVAHVIGASLSFVLGNVYCWGQTVFSYQMRPRIPFWIAHLRVLLSALGTAFLITLLSTKYVETIFDSRHSNSTQIDQYIHWPKDKPGYGEHLASTFSEWLMVGMFMLYILSFAYELRFVTLTPAQLTVSEHFLRRDLSKKPKKKDYEQID